MKEDRCHGWSLTCVLCLALVWACGEPRADDGPSGDAATVDSATPDAGASDSGTPDSRVAIPEGRFTHQIGGSGSEFAVDLAMLPDGSYVVVGWTSSFGYGQFDGWIMRFDSDGERLWTRTLGDTLTEIFSSVVAVPDSEDVLVIGDCAVSRSNTDGCAVRFDAAGEVVWQRRYGGPEREDFHQVETTADGHFLIGASTWSYGPGMGDFWVLKIDGDGDVLWQKAYGGRSNEATTRIAVSSDAYYVSGTGFSAVGDGPQGTWILKTDFSGTILWQKSFGVDLFDTTRGVVATPDGGVLLLGDSGNEAPGVELTAIKVDQAGDIVWQNRYALTIINNSFSLRADPYNGGYLIAANGFTEGLGGWLLKIKEDGAIEWQRSFGAERADMLRAAFPEPDAVAVLGTITSVAPDGLIVTDAWFGRLGLDGKADGACPEYFGVEATMGYATPHVAEVHDTDATAVDTAVVPEELSWVPMAVEPPLSAICE